MTIFSLIILLFSNAVFSIKIQDNSILFLVAKASRTVIWTLGTDILILLYSKSINFIKFKMFNRLNILNLSLGLGVPPWPKGFYNSQINKGYLLGLPYLFLMEFILYLGLGIARALTSAILFVFKSINDILDKHYILNIEIIKCNLSKMVFTYQYFIIGVYISLLFVILLIGDLSLIFLFTAFTLSILTLLYIWYVDLTFAEKHPLLFKFLIVFSSIIALLSFVIIFKILTYKLISVVNYVIEIRSKIIKKNNKGGGGNSGKGSNSGGGPSNPKGPKGPKGTGQNQINDQSNSNAKKRKGAPLTEEERKEKRKASDEKYRKKNKVLRSENSKTYYEKNKDEIKEKNYAYWLKSRNELEQKLEQNRKEEMDNEQEVEGSVYSFYSTDVHSSDSDNTKAKKAEIKQIEKDLLGKRM